MKQKNEWKRVSQKKFRKVINELDAHATRIKMPYLYYQSNGEDVARVSGDTFWNKYWIKL